MSQDVQPGIQRYLIKFHGRQKGAIGIFHDCQMFVDLDVTLQEHQRDHSARLQAYEYYEHVTGIVYLALVVRYVLTYVDKSGQRTIMGPAQGRYTHETPELAGVHLRAILNPETNNPETVRGLYGDPELMSVRACWCWPGHYDPTGIYFD